MIDTSSFHRTDARDGYAACACGWRSPSVFGDAGLFAAWHMLEVGETIDSPYLREFLAPIVRLQWLFISREDSRESSSQRYTSQEILVALYQTPEMPANGGAHSTPPLSKRNP